MSASSVASPAIRRQRVLLVFCALSAIVDATIFWMGIYVGYGGASFDQTAPPFVVRISSVVPGEAWDVAGVRAGDTLDIRDASPAVRLRLNNGVRAGEPMVLPMRRDGRRHTVTVTERLLTAHEFWKEDGWSAVVGTVGLLWLVSVATILVWRRPESIEAHLLALVIILNNLGGAAVNGIWVTPWPVLDMVIDAISPIVQQAGQVVLIIYLNCCCLF